MIVKRIIFAFMRKDGRWEARIAITNNGVKTYKSLYGGSYREAKEKMLNFHADDSQADQAPLRTETQPD